MSRKSYRKRRLFPRTLADCVEPLTKPVFAKHGLVETRIIRDWPSIVGAQMAQVTLPEKLTFPRGKTNGGSLTVLAHGGYALTLQYQTPVMLEKLAVYFGYKAVERIIIRQSHLIGAETQELTRYTPPLKETLDADPLQDALLKLKHAYEKTH